MGEQLPKTRKMIGISIVHPIKHNKNMKSCVVCAFNSGHLVDYRIINKILVIVRINIRASIKLSRLDNIFGKPMAADSWINLLVDKAFIRY